MKPSLLTQTIDETQLLLSGGEARHYFSSKVKRAVLYAQARSRAGKAKTSYKLRKDYHNDA